MKKFTMNSILTLIIAGSLAVSCKKEDAPAPVTDNTVSLLQNKNWKLTAASQSSSMGVFDIYNDFLEDCNRDDLFKFNAGGIFLLDEGPTKCNPFDEQSQPGTWSYTQSTKTIHFTLDTPSDEYNINVLSINENSFTGKLIEIDGGITYTTTMSFAKQ